MGENSTDDAVILQGMTGIKPRGNWGCA